MRTPLRKLRAGSLAAMGVFTALAISASSAASSPLMWPEGDQAMATHCAAVLSAYGQAYEFAADLTGESSFAPLGALPDDLLAAAGGAERLSLIETQALGFQSHAESLARTSFYPRLIGDGTPYLADDGRDLILAVQTCTTRFGL